MENRITEYDFTKSMIAKIKDGNFKNKLFESEDEKKDAIPITNDPRFGQNVLKNQIDAFKQSVCSGAKFASENSEDAESNPLVYYPKTGNLVFSGSIPSLSDLKFQFSLNDVTNAPYIFVDGLALTEDVLLILNKLRGFYLNWREEFLTATDLLDTIGKNN